MGTLRTYRPSQPLVFDDEFLIRSDTEFCFNLRSVLLDFQSFTENLDDFKTVWFKTVKNSTDRVSVICKLAMKWYLMRMCFS